MAQVLVRKLEEEVVRDLKRKARASGVSLEEFARRTLREAARPSKAELLAEIDHIRARSVPDPNFDSTAFIRADRDGDDDLYH